MTSNIKRYVTFECNDKRIKLLLFKRPIQYNAYFVTVEEIMHKQIDVLVPLYRYIVLLFYETMSAKVNAREIYYSLTQWPQKKVCVQ